jgi:hypothetical protein
MTIHALYRPNVAQHERQLMLLADIHAFQSLVRDNPALMAESCEARSFEELRRELEHRFEQHDALMKSIRSGY